MDEQKIKDQNWYSNKDLFEMVEGLKKEITALSLQMRETETLIRDYNDIRGSLNSISGRIITVEEKLCTGTNNRKEYIGYIVAVISVLFLLLNYLR